MECHLKRFGGLLMLRGSMVAPRILPQWQALVMKQRMALGRKRLSNEGNECLQGD